ncbi:MAG: restriction endonuclease, partial [Campylobacter lanienae]|nr:restriction endonuclease [Campylobacter lanienae]
SWERVKNESIKLPITANGEIDFEFMNNFIKAIEKLVIKDVVLYTDNKIKATKSIVSSNQ